MAGELRRAAACASRDLSHVDVAPVMRHHRLRGSLTSSWVPV